LEIETVGMKFSRAEKSCRQQQRRNSLYWQKYTYLVI